jgi:hypothetical protein
MMEHTKKMYLVPREVLQLIEEKRNQQVARPLNRTVGALNQSLEETLHRSDLPPDKQLKLFDQQAQRWQTYQDKQNQPLPISLNVIPQENASVVTDSFEGVKGERKFTPSSDRVEEDVLENVPKSMKHKAQWLLKRIKHSDAMGWNDKGELVKDGSPVPGSHMVDLINDVVRKRKTAPHVAGWQEFANGLRQLHVPQEVVGNPERWNYMMTPHEMQVSSLSMMAKKKKRKRLKHQEAPLQWEPY